MALNKSERLHRVVAKVNPAAAEQHAKDGSWPNRIESPRTDPDTGLATEHSGAPYTIMTLAGGGRRIQVTSNDGDVVGGRGANLEEALAAIEAKLGIGDSE